eukprot:Clim_evm9s142 gene=Clim_evmTU9s142
MVANGANGTSKSHFSVDDIENLFRANVKELVPYRCARDDYTDGILLDANENSVGAPFADEGLELNRYPDPRMNELKTRLLQTKSLDQALTHENMFLGVGSDEAIDLLLRITCRPGQDKILICPPTYGMYKVCAKINDLEVVQVPLLPEVFQLDLAAINDVVTADVENKIKVLWICSPNNPTANALKREDIVAVLENPNFKGVVVVDEAYIDFVEAMEHNGSLATTSTATLISTYPNLVVMHTMSKGWGLAGVRLGMAYGSPRVIDIMNRVKAPYNVSSLAMDAVSKALDNREKVKSVVQYLTTQRIAFEQGLKELMARNAGVTKVYPSDANFILFQVDPALYDAKKVYCDLADGGIVSRFRGDQKHCDNCIRVSVGKEEENKEYLKRLEVRLKTHDK